MGERLRVPAGVRWGCARDSQRWPLRVTVTDKQVSVRHNPSSSPPPSLPPAGVRDSRSLTPPRSSLHSLPDPRRPGAPGTRRSPGARPRGGWRARGGRRQMSPAPATRGTSEKFSGNWVKRKLSRGRAHPVTSPLAPTSARPPHAAGSGRRDFSGYKRRRGGGERKTCHSRLSASSPRTPAGHAVWGRAGPSLPRLPLRAAGGKWQGPEGRSPPRGTPLPKVPARHPSALTCDPGARPGHRRDSRPGRGRPPRRDPVCARPGSRRPNRPSSSERPAAAAAAGDWLRPAPPAAPPSSSVENSGARSADARPASRQAARQPRPGGAASPRPEPGAAAAGPPCGL